MLDLYDVMQRYNKAKAIEDDMMKDIELQKIQADFKINNDMLDTYERQIKEKDEDIMNLKVLNERLKDSNAELRLKLGTKVEDVKDEEDVTEEVEEKHYTYSELAENF